MNEQLQAELAAWLAGARGAAGKAGEYLAEQAPGVAWEVVALGRAERTVYLLVGLLVMAAGVSGLAWVRRRCVKEGDMDEAAFFGLMASGGSVLLGFAAVATNLHYVLTAWFAPRVYLLEQAAALVGGK